MNNAAARNAPPGNAWPSFRQIRASAGSGKTYELTTSFLLLLAGAGDPPDQEGCRGLEDRRVAGNHGHHLYQPRRRGNARAHHRAAEGHGPCLPARRGRPRGAQGIVRRDPRGACRGRLDACAGAAARHRHPAPHEFAQCANHRQPAPPCCATFRPGSGSAAGLRSRIRHG